MIILIIRASKSGVSTSGHPHPVGTVFCSFIIGMDSKLYGLCREYLGVYVGISENQTGKTTQHERATGVVKDLFLNHASIAWLA